MADALATLAAALDAAAAAGGLITPILPEPAQTVARFAVAGFRLGADFARIGIHPVVAIERLHAAAPALANVDSDWHDAVVAKYGPDGAAPAPADAPPDPF